MKLEVTIDRDVKLQVYRPGDRVQGILVIHDCKAASITEVLVSFSGCMVCSITPQVNALSANRSKHTLFGQSQSIPTSIISNQESTRNYPFAFQFPTNLECTCRPKCLLPPSLDMADKHMRIKTIYSIHCSVQYRLLGRLTRRKTATQLLHFTCNPIIPTMQWSRSAAIPVDKLNENNITSPITPASVQSRTLLPAYCPNIQLEVILPQSPILIRGRGIPVQLVLHSPPEVVQQANIYVRSIHMQLRTYVIATTQRSSQLLIHDGRSCLISGTILVDTDVLTLDLGAWGKFTVFQSQPTSTSCIFQLGYVLDVTLGISKGTGPHIQYVTACLDVVVMDPPPPYRPAMDC